MAFHRLGNGSFYRGRLPDGCLHCKEGSKMVLLITGLCEEGCYYCPLSHGRKGRDVVFADEMRTYGEEDILREAESIGATGTGITGGDPLLCMDRTLSTIRLLKDRFGPDHHIHLYTSTLDLDKVKELEEAGLDEVRFHPPLETWTSIGDTPLPRILSECGLDMGLEVPALPDREEELRTLMEDAFGLGVRFVNLNELEFSEGNWGMMTEHGYQVKDDISAAVRGSEGTAKRLMRGFKGRSVHYCSSGFKDSVQLRRRLLRRAERTAKEYELVTDDGTLLKGVVYSDDPQGLMAMLMHRGVPGDLMHLDGEKGRVDMAPWVLEDLASSLDEECYLVEEYPTADRLEVERVPLNR